MERIAQIRGLGPKHQYAIMCSDLSDIATYAKVDNAMYRLLKANTPAITTFILPATSEVPRRLMHPKRKTIGLRIPSNPICQMLLRELGEPLLTSTLILPDRKTRWMTLTKSSSNLVNVLMFSLMGALAC